MTRHRMWVDVQGVQVAATQVSPADSFGGPSPTPWNGCHRGE